MLAGWLAGWLADRQSGDSNATAKTYVFYVRKVLVGAREQFECVQDGRVKWDRDVNDVRLVFNSTGIVVSVVLTRVGLNMGRSTQRRFLPISQCPRLALLSMGTFQGFPGDGVATQVMEKDTSVCKVSYVHVTLAVVSRRAQGGLQATCSAGYLCPDCWREESRFLLSQGFVDSILAVWTRGCDDRSTMPVDLGEKNGGLMPTPGRGIYFSLSEELSSSCRCSPVMSNLYSP